MLKLWRPFKSYVLTCNALISLSVHLLCAFANSAKNATSLDLPLRGGDCIYALVSLSVHLWCAFGSAENATSRDLSM